jgi:16S rRNA processing protein RimM
VDDAAGRLEVGRIIKPHGLRGEVIVELTTNRTERLDPGTRLQAGDRQLEVVSSSPHQHRWIVDFAGVADRAQADALRGTVLSADPLDDPDEMWVHELIGARLVDSAGVDHGPVVAVQANPASDLLVLEDGGLVPLRFVVERRPGTVVADLPEGLLD